MLNKVSKWFLAGVNACIAVSHANRDNLTLRAVLNPNLIYVIPNSVDVNKFTPNPGLRYPLQTINIVSVNRLTLRKGVDLLVDVIPAILRKYPNVHFIIGGDGPKMNILKEMRDKYNIADKVELLGALPHHEVRNVLCRGHIFLNTSLTEAFCIAILEAASCGLLCVSTNVGGIPEVLPPDMIYLAPARPMALISQLEKAIGKINNIPVTKMHETVRSLYTWHNVADRTEKIYHTVLEAPKTNVLTKLKILLSNGIISGPITVIIYIMHIVLLLFCEWAYPDSSIERAINFDCHDYIDNPDKYGNHLYKVDEPSVNKRFEVVPEPDSNRPASSRFELKRLNSKGEV